MAEAESLGGKRQSRKCCGVCFALVSPLKRGEHYQWHFNSSGAARQRRAFGFNLQKRVHSGMVEGHCPCLTISSLQHHKQAFRGFCVYVCVCVCVCAQLRRWWWCTSIQSHGRGALLSLALGEVISFLVYTDLLSGTALIMGNKNSA